MDKNKEEFFNAKHEILNKTKNEIRAVLLTVLKINSSSKNIKSINSLLSKYLIT
jgi:hypothetical protein